MDAFDLLLRELRAKQTGIMDVLVRGTPEDYPAYRELIGRLRSLKEAEQIVLEIREKTSRGYDESDDDA